MLSASLWDTMMCHAIMKNAEIQVNEHEYVGRMRSASLWDAMMCHAILGNWRHNGG